MSFACGFWSGECSHLFHSASTRILFFTFQLWSNVDCGISLLIITFSETIRARLVLQFPQLHSLSSEAFILSCRSDTYYLFEWKRCHRLFHHILVKNTRRHVHWCWRQPAEQFVVVVLWAMYLLGIINPGMKTTPSPRTLRVCCFRRYFVMARYSPTKHLFPNIFKICGSTTRLLNSTSCVMSQHNGERMSSYVCLAGGLAARLLLQSIFYALLP